MHPAFSVIVFTTLSGAGYGLVVWLAAWILSAALAPLTRLQTPSAGGDATLTLLTALLLAAVALTAIGLLSSLFHLGKPLRAWRAFSQWRTSWLSREGMVAVATWLPALGLAALMTTAVGGGDTDIARLLTWAPPLAAALLVLSLLTVVCTAMIYASLKPIPAWRHRLVVPGYLVLSLQTGLALLAAALAVALATAGPSAGHGTIHYLAAAVALLSIVAVLLKLAYWRDIDIAGLPASRGSAVGLPGREMSVFERPHTQGNYLTREMGFVVARKHAARSG